MPIGLNLKRYGVGGGVIDEMGGDAERPDPHGLAHTHSALVLNGDELRQEYGKRFMQCPGTASRVHRNRLMYVAGQAHVVLVRVGQDHCLNAWLLPPIGAVNGRQHSTPQQFVDGVAVAGRVVIAERQRHADVQ